MHNAFERVITAEVGVARTPFSLRLRHGFVLPVPLPLQWGSNDWTPHMSVGPAGVREGAAIRANGAPGHIVFGPYAMMWPGLYRLLARVGCAPEEAQAAHLIGEIASKKRFFVQRQLTAEDLLGGELRLVFEVTEDDCDGFTLPEIECRIWSRGGETSITVCGVRVEQMVTGAEAPSGSAEGEGASKVTAPL